MTKAGVTRTLAAAIACLPLACATPPAAAPPAYRIIATLPLGAPDAWDYLLYDQPSARLLVAHADHTDIIDTRAMRIVGALRGLSGAHGQAVPPPGDTIYADSGRTGSVSLFSARSLAPIVTLPAAPDADAVLYEPTQRLVVVLAGSGAATLIDTATRRIRATVALGATPEAGVADGQGRVYINLASTRQIAVLDAAHARILARYPVPDCDSPHGMAIDPAHHRLFVTCRNARLLVVDTAAGAVLQTLPIGHGTDGAAFDPVRRRVFSSNGQGTLSVAQQRPDGTLDTPVEILTRPGARTLALDPATGRVFLAAGTIDHIAPNGRPVTAPGTLTLLVLAPA